MTMTDRMIDLVEEGFDLAVRNMSVPDSSLDRAARRDLPAGRVPARPPISRRGERRESRPTSRTTTA